VEIGIFQKIVNRVVIFYGSSRQEITVSFQKVRYESERDKDGEIYHIIFESTFLGYRTGEERIHQELYNKTIQKIPWEKQGFWVQDNALIPIEKPRILRTR
jgi:hypothetical protein